MKRHRHALMIFRRDLRLEDNTALSAACTEADRVSCAFILDPRQLESNPYRSDNCVQFMLESLEDLHAELKARGSGLAIYWGTAHEVLRELIRRHAFDAVYFNRDYTPFSLKRDSRIAEVCRELRVPCLSSHDVLLNEPHAVLKKDRSPYVVYTPYLGRAMQEQVSAPRKFRAQAVTGKPIGAFDRMLLDRALPGKNSSLAQRGGRTSALKILRSLGKFARYGEERNYPALSATTNLSPHNKFGTVSIREVYHAIVRKLGTESMLIRELYWRDFFTQIGCHFPHVFEGAFHRRYDAIRWRRSRSDFERWCEGRTGFPIVDAGMRELNATGYMHNRVRMVVASFLVKDLHLNWREGERYFASRLIDYDPAVNNGNWQWAASVGCDAQPYFRIFNPWIQQKKFDPACEYVMRWVSELREHSPRTIHGLAKAGAAVPAGYVRPMVQHGAEAARAQEIFLDILDT